MVEATDTEVHSGTHSNKAGIYTDPEWQAVAGAIVSFPLAGLLSDRLGPWRVTWITALLYGPALALLGFAPWISFLATGLFLFGALHGAMDVGMNGWGSKVEINWAGPS